MTLLRRPGVALVTLLFVLLGAAFLTQVVVHRDLKIGRDMGRVAAECSSTVGGVLLILGVAVGLTSWMIDADVPGRLLELTQRYIGSRWLFSPLRTTPLIASV